MMGLSAEQVIWAAVIIAALFVIYAVSQLKKIG